MLLLPLFVSYSLYSQYRRPPGALSFHSVSCAGCDTAQKKRFLRASGQLLLGEVLPFTFDRYIRKVDYANISLGTIGYNLNPSHWAWDMDDFGTNEFAHPYHGSIFFSSFRTSGYHFWESVPAAFAGSYLWETAGESEYFSPNDFINTSIGGVILGEMTYRLSNKIVSHPSRGFQRQATEVLALLINPMNGFRRITDHKWGRPASASARSDSSRIFSEFDAGIRNFNANKSGSNFGWYGHIKLLYVSLVENYRTPFSSISIVVEFSNDDSSKLNIVNVYGSLAGWEITTRKNLQSTLVLSANYDYIRNESFYYSGQSVKLNLFTDFQPSGKLSINTSVGIGPVILAAVPDIYRYQNRQYAYGTGIGVSASAGINYVNRYFATIAYRGGLIKTINGNPSYFFLHAVTCEIRYRILKGLSVCGEPGYLTLQGHYRYKTNVNQTYPYLRFSLRYSL